MNLLSTGELIFHVGDETAADDDTLGDVTAVVIVKGKPISSITALLIVLGDAIASVGNKSPLAIRGRGRGDDKPEADGRLSKEILLD